VNIWAMALIPLIAAAAIVFGLVLKGIDRIVAARMQARIGPPVTQPFTDIKKLLMKENIVPRNSVPLIFNLMPVIALASALLVILYLPIAGFPPLLEGSGDLVLVLYILIFPSLAMVIGGFASGSPYATVGAQREMVTMMSYEFPLAITAVTTAWLVSSAGHAASFSLYTIATANVWALVGPIGLVGLLLLFIALLFVMPGELAKIPFDSAEAETEIAGGLLVEYSGTNLALFYLTDAVKTVAMASIITAIFLPFSIGPLFGFAGNESIAAEIVFYILKVIAVVFVGTTFARVAIARFRITQIVKVYLGHTTAIALLGLALVTADVLLGGV